MAHAPQLWERQRQSTPSSDRQNPRPSQVPTQESNLLLKWPLRWLPVTLKDAHLPFVEHGIPRAEYLHCDSAYLLPLPPHQTCPSQETPMGGLQSPYSESFSLPWAAHVKPYPAKSLSVPSTLRGQQSFSGKTALMRGWVPAEKKTQLHTMLKKKPQDTGGAGESNREGGKNT